MPMILNKRTMHDTKSIVAVSHGCNIAWHAWRSLIAVNANEGCSRSHGDTYPNGRPSTVCGALRPIFADPCITKFYPSERGAHLKTRYF